MGGPAGFRINLSGIANPSTLYVPETQPAVWSEITVTALHNNGTPAADFDIIFEDGGYGYFDTPEGLKISVRDTTNASGVAQVTYYIPAGASVRSTVMTSVKVTLVDDGRFDNPLALIYDIIPIRIIPYRQEGVIIHGRVTTPAGNGVEGVVISLAGADGNVSGVAITRPSGSYEFLVASGWYGTIAPNATGYTFVPTSYPFPETAPIVVDMMNLDFVANFAGGNTLAADVQSWNALMGGDSQMVNVYNATGDAAIGYSVVPDSTWLHISPTSGTTPGSFTITADANTTGLPRNGNVIITATDTQASSITIPVSQNGSAGTPTLTTDITTLNVDSAASTTTINVYNSTTTTSINYIVTSNATWITDLKSSGNTDDTIAITVEVNGEGARSGTVTLTPTTPGVTGTVTITVNQLAAPLLQTEFSSYFLGQGVGESTRIYVSASDGSSRDFEVQENGASWLGIALPASGTTATPSNFLFITTQTANNTGSNRTGTIIIKATNGDAQSVSVTVTQSRI